ncbi:MAG: DNA repair exonuclease [Bradyrhizobium sp.]|uniref:metallophosphoesterase family protein n=1 Tax=Bradyrhizobium sp. TaxID=376 RepID=UPI0025C2A62E|nr:DNA repair exonuclease [Bradyrhizobium sp.]MBI5263856.1 DNA repair exonuclease [Bradyrhizobium sp.]
MKSFRFIHTGDVHLDSPLKGLAGQEGPAAERIRTATRAALDNLVTRAIDEDVAFMIIAGDLYDGDWRDYQTGLFFVRQMGRLAQAGIPVFLLYGNHDAESQITKRLFLPENVQVFSSRKPQTFKLDGYDVAVHGQSFRQRDVTENLVPDYPEPVSGLFNIGVLHTGLGGMGGHVNYAPCTLDDLINKGYQYWALAHVHQATILCEDPHVVFCGNLQGRHIREAGAKTAYLINVEEGQIEEISPLDASVVRWRQLHVPIDGCARAGEVIDRIRAAIEGAAATETAGRLLACRVELTGRSELHGQLVGSTEHLLAECRAIALALGDEVAWIERVVISTEPDNVRLVPASAGETIGDLQSALAQAGTESDLLAQFGSEFGDLVRKLPHEVRSEFDDPFLKAAIEGDYARLASLAGIYLTARLAREGA